MGDDPEVKTVIGKEFKELEDALTGPGPLTAETRKRVDLFILRNLSVLVMRTTVTEEECRSRMAACAGSCDAKAEAEAGKNAAPLDPCASAGVFLLREVIRWVPAPVVGFLWLIGKGKGWW
jgi:hypothetical protein